MQCPLGDINCQSVMETEAEEYGRSLFPWTRQDAQVLVVE